MTCAHVLDLIDAGPFAVYPRAHVEAAREHALRCPTCGPAMTMMRELETDLGALREPAPPPDFTARVLVRIAEVPAVETQRVESSSESRNWQPLQAWAGTLGAAIAVAAIQWTASGADIPFAPRTGAWTTSLIAIPPAHPAVVILAIGLLLYANGLFSVTVSASPARRAEAGDTDRARP